VALENDSVKIFGVNDSPAPWQGTVRYGIFRLSGGFPLNESKPASIAANASILLAAFPAEKWKEEDMKTSGAFSLIEQNGEMVAQYRIFNERFKDMKFSKPVVKITRGKGTVTFQSEVFVWGACIDTDGEKQVADNCFDLLPGVPYTIPWTEKAAPKVIFTGNDLF
jgi:hypothetical protein